MDSLPPIPPFDDYWLKIPERQRQAFLVRTAELLHRYGTPSHRLERVMVEFSNTLATPSVYLYTPTALIVSFGTGDQERTLLRRVDAGEVDASKLIEFDEILEDVEARRLDLTTALARMETVAAAPPPYGWFATSAACSVACGVVAVLFGAGAVEVLVALSLGLFLALVEPLLPKLGGDNGLFAPLAGFFAATVSLFIAHFVSPLDDRLATLASVVVLLPGLQLTVALTELAMGHLSAGVARTAGAITKLLTLVVGVALAWRILGTWRDIPSEILWPLPSWAWWLAVFAAPAAFAVLFRARTRQWPVIFCVSIVGFAASYFGAKAAGGEFGSFLGAFAVGCGSNLYARIYNRPALIPLNPSMLILVPGSLGYRSFTALVNRETVAGIDFAFSMLMIAIALVGGLLASTAALPPRRNL
ncbi:MAG: threonine/serine exporter family protein [Planctomycetaceae bacterium]|nr:threonine/serine exporter family protein [Planctomycetaceae bacterium]